VGSEMCIRDRLYLAAMLMGVGYMLIHIAAQNAIGNMSTPHNRTQHFSWLTLGFSAAGLLGPLLAGLAIDHGSFQIAYQILGGLSVLVLLLAALIRVSSDCAVEEMSASPDSAQANSALDLLWHNKNLREIYWLGILLAAARDLFLFVVPVLGHQRGFSATSIGLVLAAFSLGSFLVRMCVPQLVTRFCEWRMLLVAFVISAVSFVVLPFISQALLMMSLALMLGLGQGVSQPNMLALLHRATPRGRGAEAIGIRVTIGNACQLSLPLAFGAALGGVGMLPIFLGMSAMVATGMPAIWRKLQAGQGFESAALAA
jgi:predicted MFS family arabinose efflux permease